MIVIDKKTFYGSINVLHPSCPVLEEQNGVFIQGHETSSKLKKRATLFKFNLFSKKIKYGIYYTLMQTFQNYDPELIKMEKNLNLVTLFYVI